jgi:hypothetical protein
MKIKKEIRQKREDLWKWKKELIKEQKESIEQAIFQEDLYKKYVKVCSENGVPISLNDHQGTSKGVKFQEIT